MKNKDKAFDFLNEEYQKILPDNTGADEDTKTIEQIESQIYEKLENMIDQKFKDFESKVNVDSTPNNLENLDQEDSTPNNLENLDQEDSTDGNNED